VEVRVERVEPEVTLPLRWRVLRPHLDPAEMAPWPGEHDPGTVHLAARTPDGDVVGTAVVTPDRFELMPGRTDAWRLRGMATADGLRGRGIGEAVLGQAIRQVAEHGGGLLWCNARVPARRFYERAGFTAVGAEWDEPLIGPHVVMWREVAPAAG
jgi:predicted GNAT family N-acyltransferase